MKGPKVKVKRRDPLEALKMEIAAELGLLEQVRAKGWHSLSAKDAGKIGGMMTQRRKEQIKKDNNSASESSKIKQIFFHD